MLFCLDVYQARWYYSTKGGGNVTIGDKIKQARLSAGICRAELCRDLGIPIRTLENWEYNVSECSNISVMLRLCSKLNIDIYELYGIK